VETLKKFTDALIHLLKNKVFDTRYLVIPGEVVVVGRAKGAVGCTSTLNNKKLIIIETRKVTGIPL